MDVPRNIELARSGRVTCRNHGRLGYDRLTHGIYGRRPATAVDVWAARRARFVAHVQAVLTVYAGRALMVYGPTALQALGVALPAGLEDWRRCHVLVPDGTYRPVRQGVVAHRTTAMPPVWQTTSDGIPVAHPVDHWLQVRGTDDELIAMGDGLVRRQHPLITMDEFRRRLAELAGTQGVKAARRLLQSVVPGTDSLPETQLRRLLVQAGLPQPVVNLPVFCRAVGARYYLDLGYEVEQVGVEYDGVVHVGNRAQMEADAQRRRDLQDAGWLIITVTAKQMATPVEVVRSVESALVLRRASRSTARLGQTRF